MKNKLTLFFLFSCVLFSCKNDQISHNLLVECLTGKDTSYIISNYSGLMLFCRSTDSNRLAYIDISALRGTYMSNHSFQNTSYKQFIEDAINLKIEFDCKYVYECFTINDTIMNFYNSNQFYNFLFNYTRDVGGDTYEIKNNLSHNAQLTVIYYLYLNNYYTGFDDVAGYFYSEKISHLLGAELVLSP